MTRIYFSRGRPAESSSIDAVTQVSVVPLRHLMLVHCPCYLNFASANQNTRTKIEAARPLIDSAAENFFHVKKMKWAY